MHSSMYSLDEQLIDNAWVPSQSKVRHQVLDPYRETPIAEVTRGAPADVDAAVTAAST
ncbi:MULTISPECIES: hypothetical protein [unclassified Marinobacter]|uniref:hypothetical protein n=1 Tax=unclassified Marinobacter TaxID=83889 RepID=UPI001C54CED6|nr:MULTISPECIES: hypothetical protein [unclassified Marinobacter]